MTAGSVPVLSAVLTFIMWAAIGGPSSVVAAGEPSPPVVEVLAHEWHPDVVWERIGKTKFIWRATVRNNSDERKRVNSVAAVVAAIAWTLIASGAWSYEMADVAPFAP